MKNRNTQLTAIRPLTRRRTLMVALIPHQRLSLSTAPAMSVGARQVHLY